MWSDSDKRHAKDKYSITIFESDCIRERANDKSLPTSAHLVTYKIDGMVKYDIVMASAMRHIFDFYWDHLRSDLLRIEWSAGTVNPKLWGGTDQKKKK